MIFRMLAMLALLVLIYWGMASVIARFGLTRKQSRWLLLVAGILAVVVVLIAMGRLPVHFILAPIGVAATFLLRSLPMLLRLLPLWQMILTKTQGLGRSRADNGSKSVIRTEFLGMELEHRTGDMRGRVLKGEFEGRELSSMGRDELLSLARECRADQDSAQVLEAYLDRMHEGWRDGAGDTGSTRSMDEEPAMTRQLALEILGLPENAGREEVTRAHRKLMQKLHPDRGGSEYLAKKINAARDYLEQHL